MNCRDFDRAWNRLLDAEPSDRCSEATLNQDVDEAAVRGHAETCPSCGPRHVQFEVLRNALRVWVDLPSPAAVPPRFSDRILETALELKPLPFRILRRPGLLISASAAALLLLVFRGFPGPERTVPPRPSLWGAVANIGDASLRLAKTASEPAAGIGLAVLDASFDTQTTIDALEPAVETTSTFNALAVLEQVGDYAAAGAQPFSDAAREAFGFLLPSVLPPSDRSDAVPDVS